MKPPRLHKISLYSLLFLTAALTLQGNAQAAAGEVVHFSLINADTDRPITGYDPIVPGALLNLETLPARNLNIRANVSGFVESVKFSVPGDVNNGRVDSVAPYALAGDRRGDYRPWTPKAGTYTLTATPYSKNRAGGIAGVPGSLTFTVPAGPSDDTAPAVGITSPANGATLSGTIQVMVTATDNVGVIQVDFYLDGSFAGTNIIAPFTSTWDTTQEADGSHVLQARAKDAAGNAGSSSSITVTVDNVIEPPAPAPGVVPSNYFIELVEGKSASLTTHAIFSLTAGTPLPKGASWTQPESGHRMTRITDAIETPMAFVDQSSDLYRPGQGLYNGYSRYTNVNVTGEYVLAFGTNQTAYLYKLSDQSYVRKIVRSGGSSIGESSDPRWDLSGAPGTAYHIYYHSGSRVYKQNALDYDSQGRPNSEVTVYDFGFSVIADDHMDQSLDARYRANRLSNSTRVILDMKPADGGLPRVLPGMITSDGGVDISPDGKWFFGSGQYYRIEDLAKGNNAPYSAIPTTSWGHDGWAYDYSGASVHVYQDNKTDWFCAFNPGTRKLTKILHMSETGWPIGQHMGRVYTSNKKGWLLWASYSADRTYWSSEQLMMIEILPQAQHPRIWRLGTQCNTWGWPGGSKIIWYFAEAFASLDYSGNNVYWGANWMTSTDPIVSDNLELYRMELPPDWAEKLEQDRLNSMMNGQPAQVDLNRGPMLDPLEDLWVEPSTQINFTLSGFDPDGDALVYSATGLPLGATLNNNTGTFSWTPSSTQEGSYSIAFTVTDGHYADSQSKKVIVDGTAPALVAVRPYLQTQDSTFMKVVFDEALEKVQANAISHYSIAAEGAAQGVTVISAGQTINPSVVLLQTTPHTYNTSYRLTVTGVTDLMGHLIGASNSAAYSIDPSVEDYAVVIPYVRGNMGATENFDPALYSPATMHQNESFLDPQYNATIKKVTDYRDESLTSAYNMPSSPRFTAMNSDQTLFFTVTSSGSRCYRSSDNVLAASRSFTPGEKSTLRWDYSGSYPSKMYYVSGVKFMQWDVAVNSVMEIINFASDPVFTTTFPAAASLSSGSLRGDSSSDSRYWAWMVQNAAGGCLGAITFDKQAKQILGTLDYNKYIALGGHYGDAAARTIPSVGLVEISPLASKVIWASAHRWGGSDDPYQLEFKTVFDDPHAWDLNFTNPVKIAEIEGKSGWGFGSAGQELYLYYDSRSDFIRAVDILAGSSVAVMATADFGYQNWHFGKIYNPDKRGWFLLLLYSGSGAAWYNNELIMVEIKSYDLHPRIWRIADTYSKLMGNEYEQGAPSLDLTANTILWGARYINTAASDGHVDTYKIDLPDDWHIRFAR